MKIKIPVIYECWGLIEVEYGEEETLQDILYRTLGKGQLPISGEAIDGSGSFDEDGLILHNNLHQLAKLAQRATSRPYTLMTKLETSLVSWNSIEAGDKVKVEYGSYSDLNGSTATVLNKDDINAVVIRLDNSEDILEVPIEVIKRI